MKLRDEVRQFGQGMEARTAAGTPKYGVGYRVVADTHRSGAYYGGSSTAMGGASSDLVDYSFGVPVLLECFFGLWRPSCPAGLKLVMNVVGVCFFARRAKKNLGDFQKKIPGWGKSIKKTLLLLFSSRKSQSFAF